MNVKARRSEDKEPASDAPSSIFLVPPASITRLTALK